MDFIPKPKGKSLVESLEFLTREVNRVLSLVETKQRIANKKTITRPPFPLYETDQGDTENPIKPPPPVTKKIDLICIGVSTGGPNALAEVLPNLPERVGCPILIVQHMPATFTKTLSEHLSKRCHLKVKEAENGDLLEPNMVYIAPGGKHMVLSKRALKYALVMNEEPPVNSCRPSVDVLFKSVAQNFTGTVLAIILTGMGEDGAEGVQALKTKECRSIAQERQSCVVYGMPRAIINRGLADETIPLKDIAPRIEKLCKVL
ncbi:MAG TPA: chemotaxis response regulator protein-glutamate methylesterase [Opitutae bacterium]|nr:chemotaxis response regulator protein-glutamate methylesterase [Opitutae bacterium]